MTPERPSKALQIGLAVSLVLNVFLIMGVFSAISMRHHLMARDGPGRASPVMRAAETLPPQDRRAFRQSMRQAVIEAMPDLKAAHQARRLAADALAMPRPDRTVIDASLQQAREAEGRSRAMMETAMIDYALTLNPSERAHIAEGLRRPPPRAGGMGMHRPMMQGGPRPDQPPEDGPPPP